MRTQKLHKGTPLSLWNREMKLRSFTLIELLVVIESKSDCGNRPQSASRSTAIQGLPLIGSRKRFPLSTIADITFVRPP